MGKYKCLFSALLLPAFLLVGCGGDGGGSDVFDDDDESVTSTSQEQETEDSTPTGADGISYLPLMVYESYTEFSGLDQDGVFTADQDIPYIESYLISPVSSATLQPAPNAQASDYSVTVDGVEISASESFPLLQRVIGLASALRTALVFDISGSMTDVDMQALVDEAKEYVAAAQLSSDPLIANQQYTVWAFADEPIELTTGFTSDAVEISSALDLVVTNYDSVTLGYGTSIHRAVVQAIGRYNEDDYEFDSDGDNDLIDYAYKGGIILSQLAIFSSGTETSLELDAETMTRAIQSQAFVDYAGASTSDTVYQYKPVFYYIVGGSSVGETYNNLANLADNTRNLTLVSGEYSFAELLIADQVDAVEERVDLDNQFVYRYAFVPRVGEHEVIFSSSSTSNSYSLTSTKSDLTATTGAPIEELTNDLIEITGSNGEYISNATIRFSDEQTFRPATRWSTQTYGASDYSWNLVDGLGAVNADGSYTVTEVTSSPAVLTLTNITIGGYNTQILIFD